MTVDDARRFIIVVSFVITGATFVFFLMAPAMGYPLSWNQAVRMFEIIIPVFAGYVGSAMHFVFRSRASAKPLQVNDPSGLLGLLIRGPFVIFAIASVAIAGAFGYTNRSAAPPGIGMTVDMLSGSFTAALGFLTATTNIAVAYLFSVGDQQRNNSHKTSTI